MSVGDGWDAKRGLLTMAESVSTKMDGPAKKFAGKKFRVAIIGCGGIAQAHLSAYAEIPEVEIVAGVDIDANRLAVMRDKWGVPEENLFGADLKTGKTTSESAWVEMIKKVKPDAVDVCTPNGVHCAPVVYACERGIHAFVEKPMAMTPAECEKMNAAAAKGKVKLSVGFQQRYSPKTTALIEAREKGRFGDVMYVHCQALRRRGVPNWGVFGRKELQGGGPMIDIGVHILECAYAFLGSPKPIAASGNCWTYMGNKPSKTRNAWPNWDWKTYTVEDLAVGQIRFENGAILSIESSFIAHIKENDIFNWRAMGTKGGCDWESTEIYTDMDNLMVNCKPTFIGEGGWKYFFQTKLQNWVDACRKGTKQGASGIDGLNVQKMLDAIYRSAAEGREVEIN